ncbi:CoA-transferase family III [Ascoidea rubescens DSM 1968]|uniref:CoA-transferase family III n=1 Tax=Ascoidea rubescens DSM 1968 TaxID=1344418 RepID=A0A1D2VK44_9ASCO|nr:CoA-transferase family III [Ascoidea rubescens DSM 1968]ODV61963.1 CoA-transferase family III [Ascoidea rubescens DSM 1968]
MTTHYTLPDEATKILLEFLLNDSKLAVPQHFLRFKNSVRFNSPSNTKSPFLPTSLKISESCIALWALLAVLTNGILNLRYNTPIQDLTSDINIDAAILYLASHFFLTFNGETSISPRLIARGISYDLHKNISDPYRASLTNIYQTRDNKFFLLHNSLNATPGLNLLGLPEDITKLNLQKLFPNQQNPSKEDWFNNFNNHIKKKFDSKSLDILTNERYKQAGTICYKYDDFLKTDHGKAIQNHSLYQIKKIPDSTLLPPIPFNNSPKTLSHSTKKNSKPLEGIKVIDCSKIIAGPVIGKILASLGATVLRISCHDTPEYAFFLYDSNLGKRDVNLNLKSKPDKLIFDSLLNDADIIIDGYRPGVLDKLGFSKNYLSFIAERRKKGIIIVDENCYGFDGPLKNRSGWQQVADCLTGVAFKQGEFLGRKNEPVLPFFPTSDYLVGVTGACAALQALYRRATEGGSYLVQTSLCQIDLFLLKLGEIPTQFQNKIKQKYINDPENPANNVFKLRFFNDMQSMNMAIFSYLKTFHQTLVLNPSNISLTDSKWGKCDEIVGYLKSPAQFNTFDISFEIGTCQRGFYEPKWP